MPNKLTLTAPQRIFLQCSDDGYDTHFSFAKCDKNEVTWCATSVMPAEVEYVRADLVRAAMPTNADDPEDPEVFALAEVLGMTANA